MGRYEDLIAQARDGDASALDALETEFGGSTLREKAEKADVLSKQVEKAMPLLRKQRLDDLAGKLADDLKEAGLDVGDFGDFDPDDLTLETVQEKAQAKLESTQASRLAQAKEAGFESVEEYTEALEAVKQQKQKRQEGMENVGGSVASSGGEPPGSQEPTSREAMQAGFDAAKERGLADDAAMAHGIESLLDHQVTVLERE